MTHKEATSQLAQVDGEEGKGSRTTQAVLGKQEDPPRGDCFSVVFIELEQVEQAGSPTPIAQSPCSPPTLTRQL